MENSSRSLRIFLCHSSADKPAVRELYQRLQADGFEPWLDEEDLIPGQAWQREIPRAVRKSDAVIVCLSHNSVKAGYIQKEIKFALDVADEQPEDTIFIIPLKLEECDVPERLSRWQWVNYFNASGYSRLLRALHARAESLQVSAAPVHTVEPAQESRPASELESEVIYQSGRVGADSSQVNVGEDIVGRDKVVQEGDMVSGDKIIQHIEHYHAPLVTQTTAIDALQNSIASDLSDRTLFISFGIILLIGLLVGVPLAYNLFSGRTATIPIVTSTNTPTPTITLIFIRTVSPTPTRVLIPTSTRTPLPSITSTTYAALGDLFVTIREIKAPGSLTNEQVILTNLGGQVNMEGWTMTDGEGNKFTFPSLTLLSNGEVTVHSGKGTNSPANLYWDQTDSRWSKGKVAYLRDPAGKLIATYQVP
jgi:hypothetical protein